MDRKGDRGRSTREHIVVTATRLFAGLGYEDTSIELVLRECGLSRGALYHHFASKEALFTAVLEATEERVTETVSAAAQAEPNPLDALRAGCAAWLRLAASDPAVRQIILVDAPSVVSWKKCREIEARYGLGLLKAALGVAAAAGRLSGDKVDLYAHILLALLTEVALLITRSEDAGDAARAGGEAVEQILSRLLNVEPNAPWPAGASG